jgi:DNA invertase Pin-like site-specific DNA recombinase
MKHRKWQTKPQNGSFAIVPNKMEVRMVGQNSNEAGAIRVALYLRVSTHTQTTNKDSLETLEASLRAAVQARGGQHEIRFVFHEEGVSATAIERPQRQRMLEHIRRGDIDLLLVTRIDRLTRSLLDFDHFQAALEMHHVQLISLNEALDTSTAEGQETLRHLRDFASLKREKMGERTRAAMEARAVRGLWKGGHPPPCYDSTGNGSLSVNGKEAVLVRQLFSRYLELRSTERVANWLTRLGYRQKEYHSRRQGMIGGKPFTAGGVVRVLQNRFYLGEIVYHGATYEGQHQAIVQRDVFDRVQAILEDQAAESSGNESDEGANLLLRIRRRHGSRRGPGWSTTRRRLEGKFASRGDRRCEPVYVMTTMRSALSSGSKRREPPRTWFLLAGDARSEGDFPPCRRHSRA